MKPLLTADDVGGKLHVGDQPQESLGHAFELGAGVLAVHAALPHQHPAEQVTDRSQSSFAADVDDIQHRYVYTLPPGRIAAPPTLHAASPPVTAGLHRDVQEGEHPWVVEVLCDLFQVL
jgi:hypothetical protein